MNGLNSALPNKAMGESLLRKPVELKTAIEQISITAKDLCPHCGGSGRLGAMQLMAVMGGGSVRGPDTLDKCDVCNGTGRR